MIEVFSPEIRQPPSTRVARAGEIRRVGPGPRFGQREADDGLAGDTAGDPPLANFVAAVCGEQSIADICRERQVGDRGVGVGKFLDSDADSQHVAALAARRFADQESEQPRGAQFTELGGRELLALRPGQHRVGVARSGQRPDRLLKGEVVFAEGEGHCRIHGWFSYRPW